MKKLRIPNRVAYWIMVLPSIVGVYLFNTRTWPGILAAFEDFIPVKGWWDSPWVGWRNFQIFFKQPNAGEIIANSVTIAVSKIVFGMLASIIFALMINEVRGVRLKKTIQTVTYLPHFVSWVIYASILKNMIGPNSLYEELMAIMGIENYVPLLGTPGIFKAVLVITETMKEFGWGAIMYLSAIAGIDPGLYEAAEIDGANRWRQTWHVTLPGIRYIIALNGTLSLGSVLSAGFDQIFNMSNQIVQRSGDIIDTWVYRQGLVALNFGIGTAVGLFKGVIGMVLTIIAYKLAEKYANYRIF